jgi:hypothetical protein
MGKVKEWRLFKVGVSLLSHLKQVVNIVLVFLKDFVYLIKIAM